MKKITPLIFIFVFSILGNTYSQVAITTDGSAPDPNAMLDIKSSTKGFLMPRTSTVTRLAMINPAKGMAVYDTTVGAYYFYNSSTWESLSIGQNQWGINGNNIYNNNTGFVGIGTNAPQRKLHIQDASFAYIQYTNNTTGTGGSDGSFIGAFQNDFIIYNEETFGDIEMWTHGIRRLTLDSTGRMGIGKLPEDQLDVKGDLRLESTTNTTGSYIRMYGGASGTSVINFYRDINTPVLGATIGYSPTSDYLYLSNGTAAYFTPTGLGVSTSAPLTKVHIFTGQDAGLANTANGFLMLGSGTSSNVIIDNNEIMARNNSLVAPLTLQNDGGSVRIGNVAAPAGYLFAVNGKMIGEELKVQLSGNWPDYVFKNDYQLKSYDDLRKFIVENNHLPNIPPAAELEKNGMEVGDMQRRMMEKIEELTLYVLELENRIKTIEKNK